MTDRRPSPATHYVHGTGPEEQRRLGLMNEILNRRCLAELALGGEARILDVGCGLARFSRELAHGAGPYARVLGVDRDERQLAAARAGLQGDPFAERIELRRGEAYQLPLTHEEWGSFDLTWARFVLEHLDDPQRAVEQMVQATRPGGRIVLCDDDHELLRLDPPAPRVAVLWEAYQHTYRAHGNDPWIGRRLPRLLHEAGARPLRNTWVFFGSCAGAADWETVIANCRGVLVGAREEIVEQFSLDRLAAGEFEAGLSEFDQWSSRPDASFWLPLAWAEGRRMESGVNSSAERR